MPIPAGVPFGRVHPNYAIGGLDLSKYQWTVDVERARACGIDFVILRAGCGMTPDPWYPRHRAEAEKAHWPWAAYWYWYPGFTAKAMALKVRQVVGMRPPMGIFPDFERNERVWPWPTGITNAQINESVYAFTGELDSLYFEEIGHYTSPGWANSFLTAQTIAKLRLYYRNIWLAQWFYQFRTAPILPRNYPRCDLWQISAEVGPWAKMARYFGVQGDDDVDVNVARETSWAAFERRYKLSGYVSSAETAVKV